MHLIMKLPPFSMLYMVDKKKITLFPFLPFSCFFLFATFSLLFQVSTASDSQADIIKQIKEDILMITFYKDFYDDKMSYQYQLIIMQF